MFPRFSRLALGKKCRILFKVEKSDLSRSRKSNTARLAAKEGDIIETYYCHHCEKRFNERTGTQLANLRTPKALVVSALKIRTEATGLRATGRILGKSHSTVIRCQKRVADMTKAWSPPAPPSKEVYSPTPKNRSRR